MKYYKKFLILGLISSTLVFASSSRIVNVDILKSADESKTWTPPAASDTLVGRASTDTLTNKSISGLSNTFTNIPASTAITGVIPIANGGTNSSAALVGNRLVTSTSTAIFEGPAISANFALVSNSNGIPIASSVTTTTLSFVDATSSIQTQLNSKQASGNYITALTSDVSASGPGSAAATVNSVGGSTAANVHSAELLANAATSLGTVNTIVKRSGSNSAVLDITGTATSFSGSLVGDVTGTQSATVVSTVGGSSAANVHSAELLANAATSIGTANTIVKRSAANSAVLNITGTATTFTGSLTGPITSTGMATSFVDEISGQIESPSAKIYVLDQNASFPYTINSISAATLSGAVTVTARINNIPVTGISSQTYNATPVTATASATNSVIATDRVTLTVGTLPSGVDFSFTMKITR